MIWLPWWGRDEGPGKAEALKISWRNTLGGTCAWPTSLRPPGSVWFSGHHSFHSQFHVLPIVQDSYHKTLHPTKKEAIQCHCLSEVQCPPNKSRVLSVRRKGRVYTGSASGEAAVPMPHRTHTPNFRKSTVMAAWTYKIPLLRIDNVSSKLCFILWMWCFLVGLFACFSQMLPGWICGTWFGHHQDCFIFMVNKKCSLRKSENIIRNGMLRSKHKTIPPKINIRFFSLTMSRGFLPLCWGRWRKCIYSFLEWAM